MNLNYLDISTKSYYRFIEFLSLLCGINLPHERYKKIVFDYIEALSKEERLVKSLADSYLYAISNVNQPLSIDILNKSYYLLTGFFLDKEKIELILSSYYYNNNTDVINKVINVHKAILFYAEDRRIEYAFIISNYIMLKSGRGQLIPHPSYINEYNINLRIDDYTKWIILFSQMEDRIALDTNHQLPNKIEIISRIKTISETLKTNYKVSFLALYGSIVKDLQNESSDIDFLIKFDDNLIDFEKGLLREKTLEYLKGEIDSRVDLIDFNHALTSLNIKEMEHIIVLIK